ncbi:MAG TPA: AMP-binding protein [Microthrixaceae bacterium]|jgi:cyclohexanecarboxylate-CoA ligase|nr:AMP-binding protein [Microthrixaceae bacterium]HMT59999.1 AMP-binding protein [Microthrixaceae bacterium]
MTEHSRLAGQTLWDLIDARVAATPDAVLAVDETGRRVTFAEYAEAAERAAAGFAAMGIGEGSVVTWQLPTWIESLVLVAALSRLGAVQNPVLPIYREREVAFVTAQASARLLVVPSEWRGFDFEAMATPIAAANDGCSVLVVDRQLPDGDPSTLTPVAPSADAIRWLFYTSGTTADPKGARHTDASIAAVAAAMGDRMACSADDRSALVFPFTHIGGITWLFTALQFGCSLILMEAFHPTETPEVLSRNDVTLAGSGTPFHMAYLAAQKAASAPIFPSVRGFPGGGAPKPPQLVHDIREAFGAPVLSGYGLTEAPILTMASIADGDDELARSEGKPMPGVEIRLVRPDGVVAGPGEEGEIRAKAPQLMKGYLDSSLDADAFDADGYFRTGDLGRFDDEGNVIITGRLKDIIIRKGENISAKELEDMLFRHPAIADVAVIGLPDAASGERACAVVQTAPGAEPITFEAMVDYLRTEGLMVQKLPEQIEHVEVIPRNPAGKILKQDLRARYAD